MAVWMGHADFQFHPDPTHCSFRQTGLAVSIHDPLKKSHVPERLCCRPVTDPELRMHGQEHFRLVARLIHAPKLRQACREIALGVNAPGCLLPQRLDCFFIVSKGILRLAFQNIVPVERYWIEPQCLLYLFEATLW